MFKITITSIRPAFHAFVNIDSSDRFTFQNQLIPIMLVMVTGQHLHTIISFLIVIRGPLKVSNKYQKMLKLDDAFFESMAEKM